MRQCLAFLIVLSTVYASSSNASVQAADCQFPLRHAFLGSRFLQVDQCIHDEARNPDNADPLHHATDGLLVSQSADNGTAWINGIQTGINGPNGVQQPRTNRRFSWETIPDSLPGVDNRSSPGLPSSLCNSSRKAIGDRLPASIGTVVAFTKYGGVSFRGMVTRAFRSDTLPATYNSDGSVNNPAIHALENHVFAIFSVDITNLGNQTETVHGSDMAVHDDQGRIFTYHQTPSEAGASIRNAYHVKTSRDTLDPSATDVFVFVYVVNSDATGLTLVANQ